MVSGPGSDMSGGSFFEYVCNTCGSGVSGAPAPPPPHAESKITMNSNMLYLIEL